MKGNLTILSFLLLISCKPNVGSTKKIIPPLIDPFSNVMTIKGNPVLSSGFVDTTYPLATTTTDSDGKFSQVGKQNISVTNTDGRIVSVTPSSTSKIGKGIPIDGLQPGTRLTAALSNEAPNAVGSTIVPPAVTCSSFAYSAYGACQSNNTQSRSVFSSSPISCTGGSPVLSQSCKYVAPVITCSSFTYSAYSACEPNGTRMRTIATRLPQNCIGGTPQATEACTYISPVMLSKDVNLTDLFSYNATVIDRNFNLLPKTWVNNGFELGMAGPVSGNIAKYQDGTNISLKAMYIVPGSTEGDFTQVTFSKLPIDLSIQSWLHFKTGLTAFGPNLSGGVTLQVIVQADKLASPDPAWEILSTINVRHGAVQDHWIPLGLWALKKNFILAFRVLKVAPKNNNDLFILDAASIAYGWNRPLLAVNLGSSSYYNPEDLKSDPTLLKAVDARRARIFPPHSVLNSDDLWLKYWQGINDIVTVTPQFKFNLLLMQEKEDYLNNVTSTETSGPCGKFYPYYPYSQLDTARFEKRIESWLLEHKKRNVPIELIQLGNELDYIAGNADVSCGYEQPHFEAFLAKYAETLKITYTLSKKYFPNAKVVTFSTLMLGWRAGAFDSNYILKRLQNINNTNYLTKYSDVVGFHLYSAAQNFDDKSSIVDDVLRRYKELSSAVPPSMPVWITEWGFHQAFADNQKRYLAIQSMMTAFNSIPASADYRQLLGISFYCFGQEVPANGTTKLANPLMLPYTLTYYVNPSTLGLSFESIFIKGYPY